MPKGVIHANLNALKAALMLPESYTIKAVYGDLMHPDTVRIEVESPDIPEMELQHGVPIMPLVDPIYVREYRHTECVSRLDRIRIHSGGTVHETSYLAPASLSGEN